MVVESPQQGRRVEGQIKEADERPFLYSFFLPIFLQTDSIGKKGFGVSD